MKKAICLAVSIVFIAAGVILSLPGISVSAGAASGTEITTPEEFAALAKRYACGGAEGSEYTSAVMYDRIHYSVEKTAFDRIMTVRFAENGTLYSVTAVLKDGAKNVHLLIGYDLMTVGEKTYLKLNKYEDLSGGEQNAILQSSMASNRGKWIDLTGGSFDGKNSEDLTVYTAASDMSAALFNTVKTVNGMSGSEAGLAANLLAEYGKDSGYFDKNGNIYKLNKAGQSRILEVLNTPEDSGTFTLGLNLSDPARPKLRYSAAFEPVSEGSGSTVRVDETLEFCGVNTTKINSDVSSISVYAWLGDAVRAHLRDSKAAGR